MSKKPLPKGEPAPPDGADGVEGVGPGIVIKYFLKITYIFSV
jgi:hypothetical protein